MEDPRPPYRFAAFDVREPIDTRYVRMMSVFLACGSACLLFALLLPVARFRETPVFVLHGSRPPDMIIEAYPLIVGAITFLAVAIRSFWRSAPPSAENQSWLAQGVALLFAAQILLYAMPGCLANCPEWALVAGIFIVPAALFLVRAFRRERWEGWAYSQGAFSCTVMGSVLSWYVFAVAVGWQPQAHATAGTWLYLVANGVLLAGCLVGLIPLLRTERPVEALGTGPAPSAPFDRESRRST
jgi:hypothetical protein